MQILFSLFICGKPKSKHALIQKRSKVKQKNEFFDIYIYIYIPGISHKDSFDRKLKVLVLFFLPKSPDQNFEIAILFSIVKISNNHFFEDNLILQNPWWKG